jgi:hypothetical protein
LAFAASARAQVFGSNVLAVDHNATGTPIDGTTWARAFRNLTDALAIATPQSGITEIRVASANQYAYRPDESAAAPFGTGDRAASFGLRRGLTIRGGYANGGSEDPSYLVHITVLSGDLAGTTSATNAPNDGSGFTNMGENSRHVLFLNQLDDSVPNDSAVLEGFHVRGGNADGTRFNAHGGAFGNAFLNAAVGPTFVDCIFELNSANSAAGAIFSEKLPPTCRNCIFRNNRALGLPNNEHFGGGAIFCGFGEVKLFICDFIDNTALGGTGRDGGAISVDSVLAKNCRFIHNTATGHGGGSVAVGNFINCLWSRNHSDGDGGAALASASSEFVNCSVAGNSSGGSIGGIFATSSTARNSILFFNTDGSASTTTLQAQANAGLVNCAVEEWVCVPCPPTGDPSGNIACDPLFKDAAADNLRLKGGSPAIGLGVNAAIEAWPDTENLDNDMDFAEPTPDLDLAMRMLHTRVDGGGYENTCPYDLNDDGVVSGADLGQLLLAWGTCASLCCPADFDRSGAVDGGDLGHLQLNWCTCQGALGSFTCGEGAGSGGGSGLAGGGGGGGGESQALEGFEGMSLEQAAALLGYASVEELSSWLATTDDEAAYAMSQLLWSIMNGDA